MRIFFVVEMTIHEAHTCARREELKKNLQVGRPRGGGGGNGTPEVVSANKP